MSHVFTFSLAYYITCIFSLAMDAAYFAAERLLVWGY